MVARLKIAGPLTSTYGGGGAGKTPAGGGGGGTGGGGGAAAGKASDKQKDAVRTMQQVMNKLNTDLQDEQTAKNAHAKIVAANKGTAPKNYPDANSLKQAAQSWGSTAIKGQAGAAAADGIWGPATKAALSRIKQFVSEANIGNVLIQEGQGARPYREMDDAAVIKAAQENITNLGRLFQSLGMSVPSQVGQQGGSGYVLDKVPRQLTLEAAQTDEPWPEYYKEQIVTVGDLRSFSRFFKLIMSLRYTECRALQGGDLEEWKKSKEKPEEKKEKEKEKEKPTAAERGEAAGRGAQRGSRSVGGPGGSVMLGDAADGRYASECLDCELQKIADEILNKSLFRIAQEEEIEPTPVDPAEVEGGKPKNVSGTGTGKAQTPVQNVPQGDGICFYTVEDMLKWFYSRAGAVYGQLERYRSEAMPHPIRKDATPTDMDLRAANAYRAAIAKLWDEWQKIRDAVLKQINNEKQPVVTYNMIYNASRSQLGEGLGGGAAKRGRGRGRGRDRGGPGGGGGWTMSGYAQQGPISQFMRLNRLLEMADGPESWEAADKLRELSKDGRLPEISLRSWSSRDWQRIAYRSVAGDTESEQLYNFPKWAREVRNLIRALYVDWEEAVNPADRVAATQHRMWERWNNAIRGTISAAQGGMADAMSSSQGRGSFQPESTRRQREEQRYSQPRASRARPQYEETRAGRRAQKMDSRTRGKTQLEEAKQRREQFRDQYR